MEKLLLVRVTELIPVPSEFSPAYNAGYDKGKSWEAVVGPHQTEVEGFEVEILGELPAESKIC